MQSDYFPLNILNGSKSAKPKNSIRAFISVQIRVLQQTFLDTKFLRGSFKCPNQGTTTNFFRFQIFTRVFQVYIYLVPLEEHWSKMG